MTQRKRMSILHDDKSHAPPGILFGPGWITYDPDNSPSKATRLAASHKLDVPASVFLWFLASMETRRGNPDPIDQVSGRCCLISVWGRPYFLSNG